MSVGAAPNLSGGLMMSGMSNSMMDSGNGIILSGPTPPCWCNGMPIIMPGIGGAGTGGSGGSCGGNGSGGNGGGGGEGQCPTSGSGPLPAQPAPTPYFLPIGVPPVGTIPPPTATPPCIVAQGAPVPPPVPGSGYTQGVDLLDNKSVAQIPGFLINCPQTGVTQTSACGYVNFYFSSGGTVTYSTPGGSAITCGGSTLRAYESASDTYTIANDSVSLYVNRVD